LHFPHISVLFVLLSAALPVLQARTMDFRAYEPEVRAVRIDPDDAPVIDGDLSDEIWLKAAKVDKFYQVNPVEGGKPTEKTVTYIAYDENNLYFGFHVYDNPGKILATIMQRDKELFKDDNIRVFLDPYNTARDAFVFIVNPLGTRMDRLVENNRVHVDEWDTIWDVDARVVENGWTAEMAIPFRSISFDPNVESWGFEIMREVRYKNEIVRWSQISQTLGVSNVSRIGRLTGIRDIRRGMGLDAQLFAKAGATRNHLSIPNDDDLEFEPSGNFFYRITPALTGTLTFNTDFSDTPLDVRQVNTGRFSLFFPETRDFMLQDKTIFEFGGLAMQPPGADVPNGLPFFSRRIGIVGDQITDIVAGAKVSGRLGAANVGALSVLTSDEKYLDSQVLNIARVTTEVLDESRIGAIFTHGDPTGFDTNTLAGIDFKYLNSSLPHFGGRFIADFFYQQSFSEQTESTGAGKSDNSWGFFVSYPNDHLRWFVSAKEIGEFFSPALGFVNRRAIRDYRGDYFIRKRPADSWIRYWEAGSKWTVITDLDNNTETHKFAIAGGIQNQIGDTLKIELSNNREKIVRPFNIAGRLPVFIDDYRFNQIMVELTTSISRRYVTELEVTCCKTFDGDFLGIEASVELRPSRHLRLTANYTREDFSLSTGDLTVHIGSLDTSINFSPDMQIDTQMQYDNISEQFSFFSRFRWFPRPETEYFIALGHTASIDSSRFPRGFRSEQTEAIVRLGHTFRF